MSASLTHRKQLDIAKIRNDFEILSENANGRPLVYLDNAATSQKPRQVLEAVDAFYLHANANVHRGVHFLSQKATTKYDAAREKIQTLLGARGPEEIILTKGCTEGINLVATCMSSPNSPLGSSERRQPYLGVGDEILLSNMEHHSNIVPWQLAATRVGATVKVIPITDSGEIDLDAYRALLKSGKVKVVGIVHVSNSLGTVNPVREMARLAHEAGAIVIVDGAQGGPHLRVNVQDLDADFYTLSCHKLYAPTGVGVLYGKKQLLEGFPPYHGGGDMVRTVSFEETTFAPLPAKFEAGTPNVAGVIGLGAAIDYLASLGAGETLAARLDSAFEKIHARERELTEYAMGRMAEIPGLRLTGTAPGKAGIISFVLESVHPHDIGTILDGEGIAIRAGHHCCMPLMARLGVPATARASLAFYNTTEEIDALVQGVYKVKDMFDREAAPAARR